MNTATRTLMAIPLAVAALSAGAAPAMAESVSFLPALDDKVGPDGDPGPGPQIPGDKNGPNPGDNDDNDDGGNDDNDDGDRDDDDDDGDRDDDDGDRDDDDDDGDRDDDDDGGKKIRRPNRVDAGTVGKTPDEGISLAWALASGAVITAAGGFTARRAAQKR